MPGAYIEAVSLLIVSAHAAYDLEKNVQSPRKITNASSPNPHGQTLCGVQPKAK